jgi:hypothetical protein
MKRIVWSISLLILLLNTLWTPLTYAEEYAQESEKAEVIGDIPTDDVVENDEGEEQSPQFPVNENFDDVEGKITDDEDIEIGESEDDETITWDVVEELTWEVITEWIWEMVDEVTWGVVSEWSLGDLEMTWKIAEIITWIAQEQWLWFSEEITWWVVVHETWTWENEKIEYNKESIIWEKTYNDVTVKVEALSWIFPEWTELIIKPIKWWNLYNLKDQLVERKDEIKEDTTVVAFDITFIYSWEEVQPKNWEKVKVTFDYSNNDDLIEADKDDTQAIKVYHIEDIDEEWNELKKEEQKIVDVTDNGESEEDWIVVVDAESFSVYAVVVTSWNWLRVTYNLSWWYN